MPEPSLFEPFIVRLERLGVPFFVTGSTAGILYGEPWLTHDVDNSALANQERQRFLADRGTLSGERVRIILRRMKFSLALLLVAACSPAHAPAPAQSAVLAPAPVQKTAFSAPAGAGYRALVAAANRWSLPCTYATDQSASGEPADASFAPRGMADCVSTDVEHVGRASLARFGCKLPTGIDPDVRAALEPIWVLGIDGSFWILAPARENEPPPSRVKSGRFVEEDIDPLVRDEPPLLGDPPSPHHQDDFERMPFGDSWCLRFRHNVSRGSLADQLCLTTGGVVTGIAAGTVGHGRTVLRCGRVPPFGTLL